jgi:hypothetical protein
MAVVMVVMFFVIKFMFPLSVDQPETRFESHKANVSVEKSSLTFSKDGDREFFAVVGTLKNETDIEWRSPHVEARFFNSKDELIDTMPSKLSEVVLLPKSSAAFRITGYTARPSSEYTKVDVTVTTARPKARWE